MQDVQIQGLAAAYLVFEVTKFLVSNLVNKRSSFGETERFQLSELYSSVNDNQKETLNILRDMSVLQKDTAKIMERILLNMERQP